MAHRPQRRPALRYELAPDDEGTTAERMRSAAPGFMVLAGYPRGALRTDLVAGVAVAAYMIPQVMAYSSIVDLPPVVGLWTVVAATAGYALFGSSRILSAGPESTIALMAAAAVAPLTNGDPQRTLALCSGLSLVVAGWCLVGRLLKLGVVADLLSEPLLVGYLAGGAVLMVVGQLGRVTGTEVEGESIVDQMRGFAEVVGDTHVPTLVVAGGTLAGVLILLRWKPRWPGPLLAVGAATAASALLGLEDRGVEVTGSIPQGLPVPSVPDLSMADMRSLVVAGLGVAVVAYSDNTLIGRAFTPTTGSGKSTVDANQELAALAAVHTAVGFVGGYPCSASGSRTALALSSRAKTQLYSLAAAACVIAVLLFAGPIFRALPAAALGAVVLYAASTLIDLPALRRLARFRRSELLLATLACVATVVFGVLVGVAIAVALSLGEMVQRLARPHEGVLGRVDDVAGMHDVDDYPDATTLPGLIIYRYDAPLFFANINDLKRRALVAVDRENELDPDNPVRWFLLNVEANVEIDFTAVDGLRSLCLELRQRGVHLGLVRLKEDLRLPLARTELLELIGEDMLFATLPTAENAYLDWVERNA